MPSRSAISRLCDPFVVDYLLLLALSDDTPMVVVRACRKAANFTRGFIVPARFVDDGAQGHQSAHVARSGAIRPDS